MKKTYVAPKVAYVRAYLKREIETAYADPRERELFTLLADCLTPAEILESERVHGDPQKEQVWWERIKAAHVEEVTRRYNAAHR